MLFEPFNGSLNKQPVHYWRSEIKSLSLTHPFNEAFYKIKEMGFNGIKHLASHEHDYNNKALLRMCDKIIFIHRKHFIDRYLSRWMSEKFEHPKPAKGQHIGNYNLGSIWRWSDIYYAPSTKKAFYTQIRPPVNITLMKKEFKKYTVEYNMYYPLLLSENAIMLEYATFYNESVKENFIELASHAELDIISDEWEAVLDHKNKFNDPNTYRKVIPNYEEVMSYRDEMVIE
tara:strand:- start:11591 stop:12280 length:690 start_codon:yes stop_codon:yes gene_type:complete